MGVNEIYGDICKQVEAQDVDLRVVLRRSWLFRRVLVAIRQTHVGKGKGVDGNLLTELVDYCSPSDGNPVYLVAAITPRVIRTGRCEGLGEGFA